MASNAAVCVSFQWKNPDFLSGNPDFLLGNVDFLLRNSDFLLKNVDFIMKTGCTHPDDGFGCSDAASGVAKVFKLMDLSFK